MPAFLVVGARGQLGADLVRRLPPADTAAIDRAALDLDAAPPGEIDARIGELAPEVVLNAAAYNRVDEAESRPEAAFRTNALAPLALARAAARVGALLVHVSTDYVFTVPPAGGAPRPWTESDRPAPRGVYAVSKLAGEELVRSASEEHLIVRTSGLYGLHGQGGKGGSFVATMLRLAAEHRPLRVVADQQLTPTSTADLAAAILALVGRWRESRDPALLGTWHLTNAGACSWFEFAAEIFRRAGVAADLAPTTTAAYGAPAPRPPYSVLASERLAPAGLPPLRPWREALADHLAARAAAPSAS